MDNKTRFLWFGKGGLTVVNGLCFCLLVGSEVVWNEDTKTRMNRMQLILKCRIVEMRLSGYCFRLLFTMKLLSEQTMMDRKRLLRLI